MLVNPQHCNHCNGERVKSWSSSPLKPEQISLFSSFTVQPLQSCLLPYLQVWGSSVLTPRNLLGYEFITKPNHSEHKVSERIREAIPGGAVTSVVSTETKPASCDCWRRVVGMCENYYRMERDHDPQELEGLVPTPGELRAFSQLMPATGDTHLPCAGPYFTSGCLY